jgi:carboxymethylenebutenolidase
LAEPQGDGPHAAIVVIQEVFGVNAHIREVCDRLARCGYIALAPAIYQRHAPGFEAPYTEAGLKEGRKYKDMTDAEELLSDVRAAIAFLQTRPQVKRNADHSLSIGSLGFCFGGHVVYLAATLPEVRATACFYGAGITTMTPGAGEPPSLTRTRQISGTLYGFFGNEDPLIPNGQVDEIEAALRANQVDHKIFRYDDAGHGFFCDGRSAYGEAAAQDAWQQVQELFARCL